MSENFLRQFEEYKRDKEKKEQKRFAHATRTAKKKKPATQKPKQEYKEAPRYTFGMGKEFYSTAEWRRVRWEVLRESDMHCTACGKGREHGIVLHVDHKKPRSKYPHLELVKSNLQVLCEDCNIGKGSSI